MSLRYGSRTRPATMVSTWLNDLTKGDASSYGAYWLGGRYGSPDTNVIDKTLFADDSTSALAATIGYASGVYNSGAYSNNGTAGYVFGGWSIDDVYKITYATDTTSTVTATLTPTYVAALSGAANSPTNGYSIGGYGASMWGDAKRIDRMTFSTEAIAALAATIDPNGYGSYDNASASNNGTAAIIANGADGTGYLTSISKLTYSTEAVAASAASLSANATASGAHSNSGTAGYFHLGNSPMSTAINKYTYSSDSRSTLAATSSFTGYKRGGAANSGVAGYCAGGQDSSYNSVDTIDKLTYSTDACSAITPTLSNARQSVPNSCANSESL